MGSTSTQTELFPEPQFTPIEFTPTKRDAPQTAEEAIASLEAIKKLYNWSNIPAALNKDVSMESTHQYVKAWKLLRSQMPQDIAWLKSLDGKSVPGVDRISAQKIDNSATKNAIYWAVWLFVTNPRAGRSKPLQRNRFDDLSMTHSNSTDKMLRCTERTPAKVFKTSFLTWFPI